MSVAGQEDEQGSEGVTVGNEPITVEPSEGDEGGAESGGEAAGGEAADRRPSRRERRSNEVREAKEARDASERALATERQERERLAREVSRLSGYVESETQRRQSTEGMPDVSGQVTRLRREAQMHLERSAVLAKAGDRSGAEAAMDAWEDKMEEARELRRAPQRAAETERMVADRIQQMQGQNIPAHLQAQALRLAQEFPAVHTNQDFRDFVDMKLVQYQREGKPLSYENMRAAMAEGARLLRIGGQQAPTEQQRQRFQGVSQGESGGGGDGGPVRVPWEQADKKFAQHMFPTLEGAALKTAYGKYMAEAKKRGEW